MRATEFIFERQTVPFQGIDISIEREDDEIMVRASAGGKQLGSVLFVDYDGELMPQDLEVDERYRGQGIAQAMYDYVKSLGYKIRRSGQQTDAGAGFWAKHRPDSNVWEQGVAETVTNVKAGMAEIYRRLAPKIERHRDSFLAGQLYDELENYAELHGAEGEFKRMMATARNRAHMEYDTNPGGFQNWFWFLPFEDNDVAEAISKKDLISRLQKDLPKVNDPKNKDAEPVKWTGPGKDDYGYTGYQGHGMPTDKAERARIRADKKKGMTEGTDDIKKRMSKLEALALAANRAGDDAKCKMYQQKIQSLKQKLSKDMSAGVTEVKIGPEITGRSLLFKAAAMAMRDAGREGITLDYDQAIKQASRIYGIPYQPSELPKLLAQRAEIDRQLALLKQGKQVAKQRRQEKRAPTPAGAEEYWRTHALPTDRIKPPTKTLEEMQETPPEVLRALDMSAQDYQYKNWADAEMRGSEQTKTAIRRHAVTKLNLAQRKDFNMLGKSRNAISKGVDQVDREFIDQQIQKARKLGDDVNENFADGKIKGRSRPGRVRRAGASCSGSVTDLRARAKRASGEKAKMYHWCANMKAGKKKTK